MFAGSLFGLKLMKDGKGLEVGSEGFLEIKREVLGEEFIVLKLAKVGSSSKVFKVGEKVVVGLEGFLGLELNFVGFALKLEEEGFDLK